MKFILIILMTIIFTIVWCESVFAQKIMIGLTQEEVRKMFPRYTNQLTNADLSLVMDSIPQFRFHGEYGIAYFTFVSDRLYFFRWVYPKNYDGVPYGMSHFLDRRDFRRIANVIHGLNADYGPPKPHGAGELLWPVPHAIAVSGYSSRDFSFNIVDSSEFMFLQHSMDRFKDTVPVKH